jgi:hypothetical protein
MYTVSLSENAMTGAFNIFELTAADDKPIEIAGLFIAQTNVVGDTNEEIIPFEILRGAATTGTGTAATPRPCNIGDAAAGFTAKVDCTANATGGTALTVFADAINLRAGYQAIFPEGMGIITTQASLLEVQLQVAPAASTDFTGTLFVREL